MFTSPIFAILCLFYIFSSTALAASAVLGVDLGTEYIKAALVKPGIPLEIVLTKDSRRKEASTVAFKPAKNIKSGDFPERVYGSDAVALAARFPGDVYPNLKTLLGLGVDNSVVQDYATRHPALRLEPEKTRSTAAFRSGAFTAEEEAFMVEEILAMELQSIQRNAEALAGKGGRVRDLVITVPPFYTQEEKRAVELAANLAGLRVLELISDGLAVGLNYATTRTFPSINDGGKPEHHLVFDMGAGSTKATVLKFQGRTVKDVGKFNKTIQEVQVLGSGWDRTLGGDALNAVIVDDMIAQFVASPAAKNIAPTVEAVQGHGRAAAKLWKEAERLRQILSANANTQASFEGLYEDVDFKYKIDRAHFEKLTETHAARIRIAVQKALDMANLEIKDLDSVILHGGAIRTPFVQKELEKFVGNADKIRTNVNSDEAAVFGAGFRGAGLSPSFRVKEIRASEAAAYPAGIKWTNIHDKPQHQRLWQATSFLGAEKQYTFKNHEDFSILFYQHVGSSENVSPGSAEKELVTVTTQNLTDSVARLMDKFSCTHGDINVKLSTRLAASDGEVEVIKFTVDCEVDVIEEKESMVDSVKGLFGFGKKDQVPLAEDGEELPEPEIITSSTEKSDTSSSTSSTSTSASAKESKGAKDAKATKRFEVIPIKYTIEKKGKPQLSSAEITRMKDRILAFDDSDQSRRLREEALNQLEGFTYKARDLLESHEFVEVSTDEERSSLESKAKAASEWIYADGAEATREELKAKLKEMKDIVTPIEFRKKELVTRAEALKAVQEALNQTQNIIVGITDLVKNYTLARESLSSSKSAASAASSNASTASPTPSPEVNEFEGLEDDNTSSTTTTSAPPEEATIDPPVYTEADLIVAQALYDDISKWLAEKLLEQEKLPTTADPILLTKDLEAKTKLLTDNHMEILQKSLKQSSKSSRPKAKPTKKPKSKTKKNGSSKTGSAAKAVPTFDDDFMLRMGKDGELPSEEELMAWIEMENAARAAADQGKAEPELEKPKVETETKEKHDEL
jgi:hypoxia up-regulated 1